MMGNKANKMIAKKIRAKTCTVEGKRDPNKTEAKIAAFNETGA